VSHMLSMMQWYVHESLQVIVLFRFWNVFLIKKMQGIFGDFGFTREGGGERMSSSASSP
jgi:hypothetical protein